MLGRNTITPELKRLLTSTSHHTSGVPRHVPEPPPVEVVPMVRMDLTVVHAVEGELLRDPDLPPDPSEPCLVLRRDAVFGLLSTSSTSIA